MTGEKLSGHNPEAGQEFKVIFVWAGKTYEAPTEASELDRIVLPDGTVLESENGWLESMPPQPRGLREVPHLLKAETPEYIAEQMNAVVAKEVLTDVDEAEGIVEEVSADVDEAGGIVEEDID
jgi:hypothetical protein